MIKVGTGEQVTLVQFANDWIMVQTADGSKILSPLMLQAEKDDIEKFESTKDDPSVGTFWQEWELNNSDGTFARKKS